MSSDKLKSFKVSQNKGEVCIGTPFAAVELWRVSVSGIPSLPLLISTQVKMFSLSVFDSKLREWTQWRSCKTVYAYKKILWSGVYVRMFLLKLLKVYFIDKVLNQAWNCPCRCRSWRSHNLNAIAHDVLIDCASYVIFKLKIGSTLVQRTREAS